MALKSGIIILILMQLFQFYQTEKFMMQKRSLCPKYGMEIEQIKNQWYFSILLNIQIYFTNNMYLEVFQQTVNITFQVKRISLVDIAILQRPPTVHLYVL